MANTSATGGPLAPNPTPAPLEDNALLDFLHDWVAGITGLDVKAVRPRWQPEPPNIPDENVDWLAFGITKIEADTFAAELPSPNDQGYNELRRHEVLTVMTSFYGPNSNYYASRLRDGMQVAQNREILSLNSMGVVESGDIVPAPALVKERWLYGKDLTFKIRRQVVRRYGVLSLLTASGNLDNEHYITPINN